MTITAKISQIILLHPDDNIVVCVAHIYAGDVIDIDGHTVTLRQDIEVGHKLARNALNSGDKIYRYGAPIGSMTQPVSIGEHVHMHNMQSDYIPSHTRTRQNKDRSEP
ncbi:MAG: altronate hydrolase [Moraxellaceae bacterium]|nr:MAG: altronate hydrolase [Moraxellaceae bacterium]